jgi:zinc protease
MQITFDPYLFVFNLQPRQGVAPEKTEQALYTELNRIKQTPLDDHELAKVRNQAIAGYYRSLRSINGRANNIGRYEVFFGDYHKLALVEQEYEKVTAADIQRVMNTYFDANNRTVGILLPDTASRASGKEAKQ